MFQKKSLKALNEYTKQSKYYDLLLILSGMFQYGGTFPDYLESQFLENLNLTKGMVAVLNKEKTPDKQYKVGYISGYEFDDYCRPIGQADFFTRMNEYGSFEIGKDILICYNNKLRLPDLRMIETSANLTEIEKSKRIATILTRFTKIPIAPNGNIKSAIDKVIKDILDGNFSSIVNDDFLELINESNGEIKTLGITDPEDVDKLQFIYKAYDDEMRDFLEFYGQTYSATSKMAQVTTDELEGGMNFSKIVPYNMLTCRKAFVDTVNKTWGENWTVDFSEPWSHLKKKEVSDNVETSETDEDNSDRLDVETEGSADE